MYEDSPSLPPNTHKHKQLKNRNLSTFANYKACKRKHQLMTNRNIDSTITSLLDTSFDKVTNIDITFVPINYKAMTISGKVKDKSIRKQYYRAINVPNISSLLAKF